MTIAKSIPIPGKSRVMTFKQESSQDEVSKMTSYGPSMPGAKLGPQIPYLFDEVFRLGIAKNENNQDVRFIQTRPDIQYDAKDRSGVLNCMRSVLLGSVIPRTKVNNGIDPDFDLTTSKPNQSSKLPQPIGIPVRSSILE